MPPSDLDNVLRDLEKQVLDFSLTVQEPVTAPHSYGRGYSADVVRARNHPQPSQPAMHSRYSDYAVPDARYRQNQAVPVTRSLGNRSATLENTRNLDDDDDDELCVAHLRQQPTGVMGQRGVGSPSHSRSNTLKRSLSAGRIGNVDPRPGMPAEPVPPLPATLTQHQEDEQDADLRSALQCAWAVLEANGDVTERSKEQQPEPAPQDEEEKPIAATLTPTRTLTTRIYINDCSVHKTVQLTNLLTTAMVMQYLRRKGLIDSSDEWTLFEVANSHGIERPLRDWEIVMDIPSNWEPEMNNILLVKKYVHRASLTAESVIQKRHPPMYGWLYIEYKKGKWQKRFCFILDNAIHYAKDSKGTGGVPLCSLSIFDAYTLTQPVHMAPTEYVFAVRAQDKARIFERSEDYIRYFAAEDQETLRDWVLSIRCAKSAMQYQQCPKRVTNPLTPMMNAAEPTNGESGHAAKVEANGGTPSRSGTLRRHKSMREISRQMTGGDHDGTTSLSRHSSRRDLSRSATMRGISGENKPLVDLSDDGPFAKGSLLANSRSEEIPDVPTDKRQPTHDEAAATTLIHIDDKFKFSKGSLLDQKTNGETTKLSRSKSSGREYHHHHHHQQHHSSSSETGGRHMSLRRKPTSSSRSSATRHHDVPLPSAPIPSNGPLLQLDGTREQIHSKELLNRQIKPLLNFAESPEPRSRR